MDGNGKIPMTRAQIAAIMRVTAGVHCRLFEHQEEWNLAEAIIRTTVPVDQLPRILHLADLVAETARAKGVPDGLES